MGLDNEIIYEKIEVLTKNNNDKTSSITKLEFFDSSISINCGFLIIKTQVKNSFKIHKFFNLKDIISYKTQENNLI